MKWITTELTCSGTCVQARRRVRGISPWATCRPPQVRSPTAAKPFSLGSDRQPDHRQLQPEKKVEKIGCWIRHPVCEGFASTIILFDQNQNIASEMVFELRRIENLSALTKSQWPSKRILNFDHTKQKLKLINFKKKIGKLRKPICYELMILMAVI